MNSDILNVLYLIETGSSKDNISRLYQNTNEDLGAILSSYNLKNKNVLSVLASSDQLFSAYFYGAKNVDTFDVNKLTKYYYYLRKWTLKETNSPYIPDKNSDIREVIELNKNDDIESYILWKEVLNNIKMSLKNTSIFFNQPYIHNLPYERNIEKINTILKNNELNFKEFDLFKPVDNINMKYDVLILSNILEYLYDNEATDKEMYIAANNINNLLNKNGIAISSNLIDTNYRGNPIFEEYFDYVDGVKKDNLSINYVYVKKSK